MQSPERDPIKWMSLVLFWSLIVSRGWMIRSIDTKNRWVNLNILHTTSSWWMNAWTSKWIWLMHATTQLNLNKFSNSNWHSKRNLSLINAGVLFDAAWLWWMNEWILISQCQLTIKGMLWKAEEQTMNVLGDTISSQSIHDWDTSTTTKTKTGRF